MITNQQYIQAKQVVDQYNKQQRTLNKIVGKSICPFCSGTKTKPFVRAFKNQQCTDCELDGTITNKKLTSMELEDFIAKHN